MTSHKMLIATLASCAVGTAFSLVPSQAYAIEPAWVGVRAGTNGVGGEIAVRLAPTLVGRGIGQGYNVDYRETISGIDYKGTMDLGSFGVQLDFRPPLSPFYVTSGIFANNNQFDFSSTPRGSISIGTATYQGSQVGTLNSQATFADIAYYGGLGLKLGFGPIEAALEGGVYYQGDPSVVFTASGPLASSPTFQADLAREKVKVVDKLDNAKYWPMITLQARWKF